METEGIIREYLSLVMPPLRDGESIRIMAQYGGAEEPAVNICHTTSLDEAVSEIKRRARAAAVFIGLASYKGQAGDTGQVARRQCLMLDFDRKEHPDCKSWQDFFQLIKDVLPNLYYHAVTDTGGGFHVYIAIEPTEDCLRVVDLNLRLAKLVGADTKAAISTQMDRVPTSRNFKYDPPSCVRVLCNEIHKPTFKRYSLTHMESMIAAVEARSAARESRAALAANSDWIRDRTFPCVDSMIERGVNQGNRNWGLGRLVSCLRDVYRLPRDDAYGIACEFNSHCSPPKNERELRREFDGYWSKSYHCLGCSPPEPERAELLSTFCDKAKCHAAKLAGNSKESALGNVGVGVGVAMSNQRLRREDFHKMRGNDYLVLTMLHQQEHDMPLRNFKRSLANDQGEGIFSSKTKNEVIKRLKNANQVNIDDEGNISLKKPYGNTETTTFIPECGIRAAKNKEISGQAYVVYLAMLKLRQGRKSMVLDEIAALTGIEPSNVSCYIRQLHDAGLLLKFPRQKDNGGFWNEYCFIGLGDPPGLLLSI